jgi:hypothetical protein
MAAEMRPGDNTGIALCSTFFGYVVSNANGFKATGTKVFNPFWIKTAKRLCVKR